MRQHDASSLNSCLSLYSDPTDLTAFRVIVFRSDQLHIEEQNGRTMFPHGAEEKGRLSSLDLEWFDLRGTMSLQIYVPYVKLD